MRPDVERWFRRRTSDTADWPLRRLLAAKGRTTVSVVLPALDEERTVGAVVGTIRRDLVEAVPLVDEVVVVDSGSTDRTAEAAAAAGARVVRRDQVLPAVTPVRGKGEALWRGLAATSGDVVVFVDADLVGFDAGFVSGLLGPLLTEPGTAFVKATYGRPLDLGHRVVPGGGGRVTELVARPLLNLHWPQLAGFVQPLAGEYAGRRSLLERLPFPCGYGVELALLVDAWSLVGLDAMAQVDVGVRRHRHHDDQRLGRMSAEIWQAALVRLEGAPGRLSAQPGLHPQLTQFLRADGGYRATTHDVTTVERPPLATLPEYVGARARSA